MEPSPKLIIHEKLEVIEARNDQYESNAHDPSEHIHDSTHPFWSVLCFGIFKEKRLRCIAESLIEQD